MTFILNYDHIGIEMANTFILFLNCHNIELYDYRGQHDNAVNMNGNYQEIQAIVKNKNVFYFVSIY